MTPVPGVVVAHSSGRRPATHSEQHELRYALCYEALQTLRELAAPPAGATSARLVLRAGCEAETLRDHLREAAGRVLTDDGVAWSVEYEELRCHLHDTTLQVLEYLACAGYGFCAEVSQIQEVAARAASDLETWLAVEPSDGSALDVAALLRDLVADAERLGTPPVRVTVTREVPLVADDVGKALAGAVREVLTNVRKHAGATDVWVIASLVGADELTVFIADDGVGFADDSRSGIGWACSIVGRMERVGGGARVTSSAHGTQVRLHAPVRR